MVAVWLIRHGESEANAGLPIHEPTELIKLTDKGHQQAKRIACLLPQPNLIVTSPYIRTKQTAQPMLERFPVCPHVEWSVQEFDYLALPTKSLVQRDRVELCKAYWQRRDPFYVDGEGAESFASLMHRVERMFEQIRQLDERLILVFSHAGFIRAALWATLSHQIEVTPESMEKFCWFMRSLRVPNGAIIKLHVQDYDIFCSKVFTAHLNAA